MASLGLQDPLHLVKGVGPKLAQLFSKKGIQSIEDALYFVPRDYEDRSQITPVKELIPNKNVVLKVTVIKSHWMGKGRFARFQVVATDGTGTVTLMWFRGGEYLKKEFSEGNSFLVCGEAKIYKGVPTITHPDFERVSSIGPSAHFGRVVPVYSETEGLNQKLIRRIMVEVLKGSLKEMEDPLPHPFREKLGLCSLKDSFLSVHFPKEMPSGKTITLALRRLIFEEFFVLQLGLGLKKTSYQKLKSIPLLDSTEVVIDFVKGLPFQLTQDQEKSIHQILEDTKKKTPMTRLVQGDVGSGKTVVAFAAACVAARAGYQCAMLAPTEILAEQHFKNAQKWLTPLGISVAQLSQSSEDKKELQEKIAKGEVSVVIGTHAIFQKSVAFSKLALVIVDEQHRFGVEQRNELLKKNKAFVPHLLMMTATPIPRSMALTLYGDLDLTTIRQKPAGRSKVRTWVMLDRDRPKVYTRMREKVQNGEQVFIIYPLVDVSEKLVDLKSATEMHQKLQKEIFPEFKIALLHGKLKSEEKDKILSDFRDKKYQILVSTTVIEVGIDIPNATLMVVEHPERLGLSQLHQLRGRVGRGALQSDCVLLAEKSKTERLRVMEKTDDGFEIAEADLKIRGPGEFLGLRQSGLPGFRIGEVIRDAELLSWAREEANRILESDPELKLPEYAAISKMVESRWKQKIERLRGG